MYDDHVLFQADTGGPGSVSRRSTGAAGSEQFSMKVAKQMVNEVIEVCAVMFCVVVKYLHLSKYIEIVGA